MGYRRQISAEVESPRFKFKSRYYAPFPLHPLRIHTQEGGVYHYCPGKSGSVIRGISRMKFPNSSTPRPKRSVNTSLEISLFAPLLPPLPSGRVVALRAFCTGVSCSNTQRLPKVESPRQLPILTPTLASIHGQHAAVVALRALIPLIGPPSISRPIAPSSLTWPKPWHPEKKPWGAKGSFVCFFREDCCPPLSLNL